MKKFRIFFLLIIVLLFTGCTGEYNLTFNKDLSVEEEINVLIENENDNDEKTYQLFDKIGASQEDYKVVIIDDNIKVVYKKKYDSFEDYYLNSNIYKMMFNDLEFEKNNIGMSINAKSNLKLDDKSSQNIVNSYDMDNFKINVIIPFMVEKNNADLVKDNTYTWTLNSKDTYKKINIDYSYRNDNFKSITMLVVVGVVFVSIIIYLLVYLRKNKKI